MKVSAVRVAAVLVFTLLLGLVAPVQAAPALQKGSFANYDLKAELQASQTCDASPVAYNRTACGPYQPTHYAYIYDNGFYPFNITLSQGYLVVWMNQGQQSHTVTSCSDENGPPDGACWRLNDPSLPSFDSNVIQPGQRFEYSFDQPGTYRYYDRLHPSLLNATIVIYGPEPSTPVQAPPSFSFNGSIGWKVLAIDDEVALLNVSHQGDVDLGPFGPSFSEEGSFEESVNLATRIHESGTLVELLETILRAFASASQPYYRYSSPVLGLGSYEPETIYTIWWVNGPLTESSPVLILTGYSGVRGSEELNLGEGIGSRNAWIVASEISQAITVETPYPDATTTVDVAISLRFDYDQQNDLLLKSVLLLDIMTSTVTAYSQGQTLCGSGGCRTVSERVVVTQQVSATASLSLQLANTNVPMGERMIPQPPSNGASSEGTPSPASPPDNTASPTDSGVQASTLLPLGIAGATALGLVSLGVWLATRARKKPPSDLATAPVI